MKSPCQLSLCLRTLPLVWLLLSSLPARADVLAAIGQNFNGTSYGTSNTNSGAIPPDGNGAVGPNYFVEFINGMFTVYNKTNGQRVLRLTDLDFWANADVSIDVGNLWTVSDPRIIYDPVSGRWFASEVDVDQLTLLLEDLLAPNHFLFVAGSAADRGDTRQSRRALRDCPHGRGQDPSCFQWSVRSGIEPGRLPYRAR